MVCSINNNTTKLRTSYVLSGSASVSTSLILTMSLTTVWSFALITELFEGSPDTVSPAAPMSRDLVEGGCSDNGDVHFLFILLFMKSLIRGVLFLNSFKRVGDKEEAEAGSQLSLLIWNNVVVVMVVMVL